MKKGDRIIWDSDSGYEIGYFIEDIEETMYCVYKVNMVSGVVIGETCRSKDQIYPYTPEKVVELNKKYGYTKEFSEQF